MPILTRRRLLASAAAAGAVSALRPARALAYPEPVAPGPGELVTKTIPSSGEKLPLVGLGSWITFNVGNDKSGRDECSEVMRAFFAGGGRLIDSSPMYGSSQEVIGYGLRKLGLPKQLFSADKVWISSGKKGPDQIEESRHHWGVESFDLLQVHNLMAWEEHLPTLFDMKKAGRLRYVGVTTSDGRRHDEIEKVMRSQPIDFVQITYNVLDREIEERILPLAQERKIGVMAFFPLGNAAGLSCTGSTNLFARTGTRPLPEWAADFDAKTWAQFFIKYVLSHPAITVVRTGTTKPAHMLDNIGGGIGRLPNEATRKRMAELIDALPPAPPPGPPAPPPGIALSAEVIERYVGEYKSASGFTVTIRRDGATLFVKPGSNPEVPLLARSETRFQDPRGPFFEFQIDGQGKVTGAVLEQQGPQGTQRMPLERK